MYDKKRESINNLFFIIITFLGMSEKKPMLDFLSSAKLKGGTKLRKNDPFNWCSFSFSFFLSFFLSFFFLYNFVFSLSSFCGLSFLVSLQNNVSNFFWLSEFHFVILAYFSLFRKIYQNVYLCLERYFKTNIYI